MLGVSASAPGADVAYTLMPYRPWYPALHLEASLDSTAGDARFDDSGERRDSAVQGLDRRSAFPRREARLALAWTFPLFEQEALPFVSRRLHTARLRTAYVDLDADGGIAAFVDARPRLQSPQSGLGDVELEFGTWLSGSSGWRQGQVDALSTLLLFGLRLPVGVADVDAPASAGTRALAASLKLGAHAAIWRGATLDAGLGWRVHARNPEPMFGALAPTRTGDALLWDAALTQRLRPGLYAVLAATGQEGQANRYRDPRFTTQAIADPSLAADTVPVPGLYRDAGTDWRAARVSLHGFVTQRLVAGLHYLRPISGAGGAFDLDLQQRTPAGCNPAAPGCVLTPAGRVEQDGYGAARSEASDRIALSLTWQFGQGDRYACTGCRD